MANINSILKSAAVDTAIYTLGKIAVGVTGIISIKLFTSLFSPTAYGDYSLINTTVNIMLMVLYGWLVHSGFRFAQEYSDAGQRDKFYSTLIICAAIVTGGSIIAAFLILTLVGIELSGLIVGGILFLGTQSNSVILFNLIRAQGFSGTYSMLMIYHSIVKLIAVYLLTKLLGLGAESIFFGAILLDLSVIIYMAVKLDIFCQIRFLNFSKQMFKRFYTFGYPLIGVSVATWILSASDKYLIKFFRTSAEVGIYSISYSLVAAGFTLINTSLMLGVYPVIIKTWNEHGKEHTEELMGKILRYYLMVAVPALVGLSVLAEPVMQLAASPEYMAGVIIIPWVAAGLVCQGLTEYVIKIWELQENTKIIFFLMLAAAVINILLNIWLVPVYGILAAAITTVVAYLFYLGLAFFYSSKIFAWKLNFKSLGRIGFAALIMALIFGKFASIINHGEWKLLIGIPVGAVIYLLALLVTGEIREETTHFWQAIKKRSHS